MGFVTTYYINYGITVLVSMYAQKIQEMEDDDDVEEENQEEEEERDREPSLLLDFKTAGKILSPSRQNSEDLEETPCRTPETKTPEPEPHHVALESPPVLKIPNMAPPLRTSASAPTTPMTASTMGTSKSGNVQKSGGYYAQITAWQYAYDSSHKPFVLYRLDFRYMGSKWTTWKRYSHFIDLHNKVICLSQFKFLIFWCHA
jgi:hypothetical protein